MFKTKSGKASKKPPKGFCEKEKKKYGNLIASQIKGKQVKNYKKK